MVSENFRFGFSEIRIVSVLAVGLGERFRGE